MLSEKLVKALSNQINSEMASSYLYLSMSAHFEAKSLHGFANWLRKQAEEELQHGMKIYDFVFEAGAAPVLGKLDAPKADFGTAEEVFKEVLEHEKSVTESINKLYELALKEKDYKTQIFLTWFINEQVEEEAAVEDIIAKFSYIGGNSCGLLTLDKELNVRN